MLDAPRQQLVDRIPGEPMAQDNRHELGDQSAAGWASGLSAPEVPQTTRPPSARTRCHTSQTSSEDTRSTRGSTLVEDDDGTVSSLGDPDGTHQVGTDGDQAPVDPGWDGRNNLPTNEPWNHALLRNKPIGDAMRIPKPGGWKTTRFCMQNPNGIQVTLGGKWKENCKHQQDMEVDWMGYSGSDLNTVNPSVMKRLHADADDIYGRGVHKIVTGHTNRESAHHRKPGGTMALVVGWLKDKVFETGKDPYGRWVYTKIRGNQGRILTFICTYQVCQDDRKNIRELGESTFAKQQMAMFMEENRRDPRRLRYHHRRDLVRFVQECQNKGELVNVGGDFNEVLGLSDADGLERLCTECGLVDIILAKHGRTDFDTYIRGSSVLDYFLISPELEEAVLACGYEPYNIRTMGDHRAFYVDFDTVKLLGGTPTFSSKMASRDINSKKYHQIPTYFKHRIKHLENHKFFQQMEELQKCMDTDTPNHRLAQKLDHRFQRSAKHAGNKCPRYPRAPYSPAIAKMRNICQLLRQAVTQLTHSYDMSEAIQATRDQAGSLDYVLPTTLADCETALKDKKKELVEAEKQEIKDAVLRRKHQDEMIAGYLDEGKKEHAQLLKKIKRGEAVSKVFSKLRAARGLNTEGGLSYISVPVDPECTDYANCQEWREETDQDEIDRLLTERNRTHFGQSKDANLCQPPVEILMDFEGSCAKADMILQGEFPEEGLTPATKWIFQQMKYVALPDSIPWELTVEEYEGKIKSWKETTSTSPVSGVHLGHGKVCFAKHLLDKGTPEALELEEWRSRIIVAHVLLLNYALKFGYVYERWLTIVNAMLEKDPGSPLLHRLRVIHLYEWDWNLLMGVKWRHLLHRACDQKLVNENCYGSMPGKECLDPVFVKELEYEIARLMRLGLIVNDDDSKACYDRIHAFIANLVGRSKGLHKKVCIVHGRTLKEAKYHVQTKLGISARHIQHGRFYPLMGTGQGSTTSPPMWLFICSALFDVYCQRAKGAFYTSPDRFVECTLHILGFVDDTCRRTNAFAMNPQPDIFWLLTEACKDAQLWHDILQACNQTLEASKCKYHAIHFTFDEEGAPEMVLDEMSPRPIFVEDGVGHRVEMLHQPSNVEIKYLGCHKAPLSNRLQLQAIAAKCDDFARIAKTSVLTRLEAHLMYQAIYRLSVGFPLPMCYFTFKELDRAQKKAHRAMVSKCGYNKNSSLAMLYGPTALGGEPSSTCTIFRGLARSPTSSSTGGAPTPTPVACLGSQCPGCSFAQELAPRSSLTWSCLSNSWRAIG